ncbi:hypothetical protein G5714_018896 [Onychostoma macrolepis]|uniref:Uncharacterized protein n=1 Tax=Onychostoma macrolepis TaxID=369639 RepID=A0A7J6C0I2_9TELE|nr:hypothetical protein G5714_018896 [Onychostoma macrolepis]
MAHSRPDKLTFSNPSLGKAYPSDTASTELLANIGGCRRNLPTTQLTFLSYSSDSVSPDPLNGRRRALPARQPYLLKSYAGQGLPVQHTPLAFKQVSTLTSWMAAKRPDQLYLFRLYLFDTVSLDLPSNAERRCRSRPPTYFSVRRATTPSHQPPWVSPACRTPSTCLFYPHTFSPRLARPTRPISPESQSPSDAARALPVSGFSLLPTCRQGYPSDIVVLISCRTLTLVSRWAPVLAARK